MPIADLIQNDPGLESGQKFAAILGLTPSKGARSPLLWNAAFAAFGRRERMVPLDIAPDRLDAVIESLAGDPDFIGGAITMPYKEPVAEWLGAERLEPEAAKIGAINCLYRDADGALRGANTDGEAALLSVRGCLPDLEKTSALLIGPGGAGKAVAAYLAGSTADLTIAARNPDSARAYGDRLDANVIAFQDIRQHLDGVGLVVNCTSLGFANGTPAGSPLTRDEIGALDADTVVFDIVYDPLETPLLQMAGARGLKTLNGLEMNRLQAVQAFVKATGHTDLEQVKTAMQSA